MARTDSQLRFAAITYTVSFIFRGAAVPLTYLINLLMARYYGAEAMGTYYLAINIVMTLFIVTILGTNTGLLKYVSFDKARNPEADIAKYFWSSLMLTSLLCAAVCLILWYFRFALLSHFNSLQLLQVSNYIIIGLVLSVVGALLAETARGLGEINLYVFTHNFFPKIAMLLLILFFVWSDLLERNAGTLILSYLTTSVMGVLIILSSRKVRKNIFVKVNASDNFKSLTNILRYSWPIYLGSLVSLSLETLDSLILGFFSSPATVAYYNASLKTVTLINFPLLVVNSITPPLYSQYYAKNDINGLGSLAVATSRWAYYIALPITLIIILLAPQLLGIFGRDFVVASSALIIMAAAQLFNVCTGSVRNILLMTEKQKHLLCLQTISGFASFGLIIILTYYFGLLGAATAYALGVVLINLMMALAVWRLLRIKAYAQGVGWATWSGLAASCCFFLSKPYLGSWVAAAVFLLIYLMLISKRIFQEIKTVLAADVT